MNNSSICLAINKIGCVCRWPIFTEAQGFGGWRQVIEESAASKVEHQHWHQQRCCPTEPFNLCEFLVEASFCGSGCRALISRLCTKKSRALAFSLWGPLVFILELFFLFCCAWSWCRCWEGLQSKKKATHSHTNANRRQQSKASSSGFVSSHAGYRSSERRAASSEQRLSTRCIISMRQIAAFFQPQCVDPGIVWWFESLNLWKTDALFDQREHVVSLPSPVAWNHSLQERRRLQLFVFKVFFKADFQIFL